MADLQFSTHIACTEDWQPMWRHSSVDVIYYLHLIWSNWLIILVVSLVATPSAATSHSVGQESNDNQNFYTYPVQPRYLDRRQCVSLSSDDQKANCNCTRKPPDIKEVFKELPWQRGTPTPVVPTLRTTTMTSTPVMIPEKTASSTTSASTAGLTTPLVKTSPSATHETTPPRRTDNPNPLTRAQPTLAQPTPGKPRFPFDSHEDDDDEDGGGGDGSDDESKEISGNNVFYRPKGSGSWERGGKRKRGKVKPVRSTHAERVSLSFAIIIPILLVTFIIVLVYVLYRTQRGRRGRYQIQSAFTRIVSSRRNQSPSTNANGSANNQQSDIEINAVKASPHHTNGGTPAKCGTESEVTSDQEEGNVNSHMLKQKSEPSPIDEERRRSSCKTPDENRRPSRQIRLDSQSPLVSNMDLISDEEDDGGNLGSNGHLEGGMIHDSMLDDTFDVVCLEDNSLEDEMNKRNSSNC